MVVLFDFLHWVLALALSILGLGYERDDADETVRYTPAAYIDASPYAQFEIDAFQPGLAQQDAPCLQTGLTLNAPTEAAAERTRATAPRVHPCETVSEPAVYPPL